MKYDYYTNTVTIEKPMAIMWQTRITRPELLKWHREYWAIIAENNLRTKPLIEDSNGQHLSVTNQCFLCEYALTSPKDGIGCEKCPAILLTYGDEKGCLDGLYAKWRKCEDDEERKKLAYEIANLKMKSDF